MSHSHLFSRTVKLFGLNIEGHVITAHTTACSGVSHLKHSSLTLFAGHIHITHQDTSLPHHIPPPLFGSQWHIMDAQYINASQQFFHSFRSAWGRLGHTYILNAQQGHFLLPGVSWVYRLLIIARFHHMNIIEGTCWGLHTHAQPFQNNNTQPRLQHFKSLGYHMPHTPLHSIGMSPGNIMLYFSPLTSPFPLALLTVIITTS